MKIVAMSALGWGQHEPAAQHLLQRLAGQEGGGTALVDHDAVVREAQALRSGGAPPAEQAFPVHCVRFDAWLKPGLADGGVLDEHAIRSAARDISADHIVVVDVRAHRPDLIRSSFMHLRHAWYPLDEWHPAFVLVVDDLDLLHIGQELSSTFYCEPQLINVLEEKRIVREIARQASILRWIGPGFQRWQHKFFYRAVDRWAQLKNRREAQRLARD